MTFLVCKRLMRADASKEAVISNTEMLPWHFSASLYQAKF